MKDFWEQPIEEKKINKKKIIISIVIAVVLMSIGVFLGVYFNNKDARNWIDKNIFRKEVAQDSAVSIKLK